MFTYRRRVGRTTLTDEYETFFEAAHVIICEELQRDRRWEFLDLEASESIFIKEEPIGFRRWTTYEDVRDIQEKVIKAIAYTRHALAKTVEEKDHWMEAFTTLDHVPFDLRFMQQPWCNSRHLTGAE